MTSFQTWCKSLYKRRFYYLLTTIMLMLLLPVFFDEKVYGHIIWPAERTLMLIVCINILQKIKRGLILVAVLGILATGSDWLALFEQNSDYSELTSLLLFGLFICLVSYELFEQIRKTESVDLHTMVGAFDGFLLIGIVSTLVFSFLHLLEPGSFNNVLPGKQGISDLFYFSYITLTSIGYGDITPLTEPGKRLAVFFGLVGQFYMVIVMALLVGKFLYKPSK